MKPAQLLRRLKRLAKQRDLLIEVTEGANHTKVVLAGQRTIIGRHAADLKTGTLHGILKQLGLSLADLEE